MFSVTAAHQATEWRETMNIAINKQLNIADQYRDSDMMSHCMAIIWTKKLATADDKTQLLESVQTIPGVVDAEYAPKKPLILKIRYENERTSACDIVGVLRKTENQVRLVGC